METVKDNVLYYTDGHAVTVTDSVLQVKRKWYKLNGITHHGFLIIPPFRLPGIMLLALGAGLVSIGAANLIPYELMQGATIFNQLVSANQLAIAAGILLLIGGILVMVLNKERYAVSITTAEGERHVVVSTHKEYVSQIVNALNEAFFAKVGDKNSKDLKKQFTVSGR